MLYTPLSDTHKITHMLPSKHLSIHVSIHVSMINMPVPLTELDKPGLSGKAQSIWDLLRANSTVAFGINELMNHIDTESRATLYRHLEPLIDSNRIAKRRHATTHKIYYYKNPDYQPTV